VRIVCDTIKFGIAVAGICYIGTLAIKNGCGEDFLASTADAVISKIGADENASEDHTNDEA